MSEARGAAVAVASPSSRRRRRVVVVASSSSSSRRRRPLLRGRDRRMWEFTLSLIIWAIRGLYFVVFLRFLLVLRILSIAAMALVSGMFHAFDVSYWRAKISDRKARRAGGARAQLSSIFFEPMDHQTLATHAPGSPRAAGVRRRTRSFAVLAEAENAQHPEGPTHLYVLIHGLGGTPHDLACLEKNLKRRGGDSVLVHAPGCNALTKSFDGIANGAKRVADDIRAVVAAHPSLVYISMVGNSLGGVYARYAAALLYEADEDDSPGKGRSNDDDGGGADLWRNQPPSPRGPGRSPRGAGTIAGLIPDTYLTTATPHLGVGPFGWIGLFPAAVRAFTGNLMGPSTRQLMLLDAGGVGKNRRDVPLLVEMGEVGGEGFDDDDSTSIATPSLPFIPALASFRRRCAYANAVNDFLVAYETASLDPDGARWMRERRKMERQRSRARGGGDGSDAAATAANEHHHHHHHSITETVSDWADDAVGDNVGGWAVGSGGGYPPDFVGGGFGGVPRIVDERETAAAPFDASLREMDDAQLNRSSALLRRRSNLDLRWQRRMSAGLRTMAWHHVDVEFPGFAPLAHNKICALQRDPIMKWLFAEGEFVVEHQAEYLLARGPPLR